MAHTSRGCRAGSDEIGFAGVPVGAPLRGFGFEAHEGRAVHGAKAARIYAKDGCYAVGQQTGFRKRKEECGRQGRAKKKKRGCTGDVMELRDKVRFECLSVLCNPTPTASCRPAIERSSFLGIQILLMRPPIEPIQPFSKGKYTANFKSEQGSRAFFADSSLF